MSQNRNRKSSSSDKTCGSFLSRHRSDAQVALQQSLILQSDMDKIIEMNYNGKCEVTLRSVLRSESLRPFTQLDEQTRNEIGIKTKSFPNNIRKGFRMFKIKS